jgi:hypothetical protein
MVSSVRLQPDLVASGFCHHYGYRRRTEACGAAVEAETGLTSRCAIYDMNSTKITAPMAAPKVRVTGDPL